MLKSKGLDEYIDTIIEGTNAKFDLAERPVIERIEQLSDFKGLVSKKMMSLYSILDELKEMFKKFSAEEQVKFPTVPVFLQGAEFYCNLFKFDGNEISAQLEKKIKRTRVEKDKMLKLKEEKVNQLLEYFESMQVVEV